MKLYYRGLSYEYQPNKVSSKKTEQPFEPVSQISPASNLMYCGVNYRVDPNSTSAKADVPPLPYKLSFRGISYVVNNMAAS